MGNAFSCVLPLEMQARRRAVASKALRIPRSKSRKQALADEEILQQQALAMALLQQQLRFERSASVRNSKISTTPKQNFPRSASVRARQASDPVLDPHQLLHNKEGLQNLTTKHFVLIHGGGFGAWCWYKIIALLEDTGFTTSAIDLAGSGIDSSDPNCIRDLNTYCKPLTSYLQNIPDSDKVILVAHDVGGVCISHAMELFPLKIAKSVFVSAMMIRTGQSAFDVFAQELAGPDCLLRKAQIFNYGNKDSQSPTSVEYDKAHLNDLLFNQSPSKDVALATVSMRPVPFSPLMEKISISAENYGIVPRYYVMTGEDRAFTIAMQEKLAELNPPNQVFRLKGADHAPFFSKPQALSKVLAEIAQIDTSAVN